jgi:hypothetical protein
MSPNPGSSSSIIMRTEMTPCHGLLMVLIIVAVIISMTMITVITVTSVA